MGPYIYISLTLFKLKLDRRFALLTSSSDSVLLLPFCCIPCKQLRQNLQLHFHPPNIYFLIKSIITLDYARKHIAIEINPFNLYKSTSKSFCSLRPYSQSTCTSTFFGANLTGSTYSTDLFNFL